MKNNKIKDTAVAIYSKKLISKGNKKRSDNQATPFNYNLTKVKLSINYFNISRKRRQIQVSH